MTSYTTAEYLERFDFNLYQFQFRWLKLSIIEIELNRIAIPKVLFIIIYSQTRLR